MELFYQFMELFATFIESVIVISVASCMAQKRYTGKKHILLVLLFSVIETVIITLLNSWQFFSFVTIGFGLVSIFIILNFISKGNILLKITSSVVTWFFMFAVDYLLSYSIVMIMGKSVDISQGVSLILTPGTTRTVFLLTDKALQIAIFILCRKLYPKIRLLSNKNLALLSTIALLSFVVMNVLTAFILTDSLLTIQVAVIFATFFIVLSLIATIFAIAISAKHQNEKRMVELMKLSSQMLEKNYSEIHNSHEIIRQQLHDFKNHLRTICSMAEDNSAVRNYASDLLESSYSFASLCSCGNDIIDSIINCKAAEAKEKNITFSYNISLSDTLKIDSVDICAILANQLDNAIEACEKADADHRKIDVFIAQKESFVLFRVINTAKENPFDKNNNLPTSKNNNSGLHGFGIRIIRKTAEKYNGISENSYDNGLFTSSAMLSNND
ncbi:MAG: GHKL domain-containing protein [Clostridia bacterium]|nr:GHKL domain-containing protein [Clostridia bacterium]